MEKPAGGKRIRRSPSLPPLLPHTPPQPRARGHRFSAEESHAFGRKPFVKCNFSEAEARSVSSSPVMLASKSEASLSNSPSEPSWISNPEEARSEQLQEVIERLLPTQYGSFGDPATAQQCRTTGFLQKRRRKSASPEIRHDVSVPRRGRVSVSKAASSIPKDVLERFRLRVLKVHRSLHDAFAPLERRCYFDSVVGMHEVRTALSRVDVEAADELLIALNPWPAVSLSAFFDVLVSSSPEASIWELGAGLIRHVIWPNASKKSLEDMRKFVNSPTGLAISEANSTCQNFSDGASQKKAADAEDDEAADGSTDQEELSAVAPHNDHQDNLLNTSTRLQVLEASVEKFFPSHLEPALWNRFCAYLGLKSFEAKRLCMLLGDSTGIHLPIAIEAVRVTVSPGTSLPRLAMKAIDRYNSLRSAFHTHCSDPGSVMRWLQFVNMVRTLDVPDRFAMKLWVVLVSREILNDSNIEELTAEAKAKGTIHLEVFVKRLAFWVAGNEMVEGLKQKLRESFGNLQEARRVFRKYGLPSENKVSPARLGQAFKDVGVTKCDPDVVILAARNSSGKRVLLEFDDAPVCGISDCVTLDDIIDVMRSQPGKQGSDGVQSQSETQALQRQLHDVFGSRSNFKKRRNSSCPPAVRSESASSDRPSASAASNEAKQHSQVRAVTNPQVETEADSCFITSTNICQQKLHSQPDNALSHPVVHASQTHNGTFQAPSALSSGYSVARSPEAEGQKMRSHSSEQAEPSSSASASTNAHSRESAAISSQKRRASFPQQHEIQSANRSSHQRRPSPPPQPQPTRPAAPQERSPPPPRLKHSTGNESSPGPRRQLDYGITSPEFLARSPDLSYEVTLSRTQLSGMRGRSLSPMPAPTREEFHTSGMKNEPCSLLNSNVEPPRNAWATASQWNSWRSTSVPPVLNSTHRPDGHHQELRNSGSVCCLPGITSQTSGRDEHLANMKFGAGASSVSNLMSTQTMEQASLGALKLGTGAPVGRRRSKIWK